MYRLNAIALSILAAFMLVACGGESPPPSGGPGEGGSDTPGGGNGGSAGAAFRLAAEPEGEPVSVKAARELDAGTEVVVIGRVYFSNRQVYGIQLIDRSLLYCGEDSDEECRTPWDYCCYPGDEIAAALMFAKFTRDMDSGMPVRIDGSPGWRPLDLVKVVGKVHVADDGAKTIIASGYWPLERPECDWEVDWESVAQ